MASVCGHPHVDRSTFRRRPPGQNPDTLAIHPQVRLVVKPYASALPLGFFTFGIGMFLLAASGAQWVERKETHSIGILLVTFVFPLEFLAAVIAFLARDTMAAAALGVFSTSWLAIGALALTSTPGVRSAAFGYYLAAFAIMIAALASVAALGNLLIAGIMSLAVVRAATAAAYELGAAVGVEKAGGWIAVLIFAAAMYGGLAFLLEDVLGKRVLPTFRRGAAREAVEGDLHAQLGALEAEAGIRQSL